MMKQRRINSVLLILIVFLATASSGWSQDKLVDDVLGILEPKFEHLGGLELNKVEAIQANNLRHYQIVAKEGFDYHKMVFDYKKEDIITLSVVVIAACKDQGGVEMVFLNDASMVKIHAINTLEGTRLKLSNVLSDLSKFGCWEGFKKLGLNQGIEVRENFANQNKVRYRCNLVYESREILRQDAFKDFSTLNFSDLDSSILFLKIASLDYPVKEIQIESEFYEKRVSKELYYSIKENRLVEESLKYKYSVLIVNEN